MRWIGLLAVASPVFGQIAVTDYGAVGDGATDCTAAFQQALDTAAERGGELVTVPAGQWRLEGTLSIPGGVRLQGTHLFAPTDQREGRALLDGSVLLAFAGRGEPDGPPLIDLAGSNASVAGFMIHYPEITADEAPPVPYPPTIAAGPWANVAICDLGLLNSYEGIRLQDTGRFLVRNVHGFPSFRGLRIDRCLDIGRVENVHFWPFGGWWRPDRARGAWINLNATAFEFGRYDWCYVINTFCFGYGVGYRFIRTENGVTNGSLIGIGADSCERAVLVEATSQPGLQIVNAELVGRWGSVEAVCLDIAPEAEGAMVNLSNSTFWGPIDRCIRQRAPGAHLIATGCTFANWDTGGAGSPAVEIETGKAIIQANNFLGAGTPIRIGPEVVSAIIIGNQAPDGLRVENEAGARTQLLANEQNPVEWTDAARRHYRLDVGAPGDGPYLYRWYSREAAPEWPEEGDTKRWSTASSELRLPVVPGVAYRLTIETFQHPFSLDPANGIYLGEQLLAPLAAVAGAAVVEVDLPPSEGDEVRLRFRAKAWQPSAEIEGSGDVRRLGAAVRSLTLRAVDATERVFSANTGAWLE